VSRFSNTARELPFRRKAEGDRQHDATRWKNADVISRSDWRLTDGIEWINVGSSIGRNVLRGRGSRDRLACDAVLVEKIVEAQPNFALIEAATGPDGVVEKHIGDAERVDHCLIMISAVVLVESADTLIEETEIPCLVLVGHTLSLRV